jgi:hypothetical protein
MGKVARFAFIVTISGVVVGCGDGTGPSADSIAGTWTVTKADVISVANPSTKTELVALGFTGSLVLNSNQTFVFTTTIPGDTPEVSSGTYAYTSGQLTLTTTSSSPPETLSFTVTLSGSTMTLTGGIVEWDFGAGTVEATLNLTLTK